MSGESKLSRASSLREHRGLLELTAAEAAARVRAGDVDRGDLSDVKPTSHVVEVENVLRADEPRPSLPAEEALASAPDAALGGFRVPSPGAG